MDALVSAVSGPSDIPTVVLGTSMICMSWFGFNAGNALAPSHVAVQALLNTQMALSTSAIGYQIVDCIRGRQVKVTRVCFGAMVGLVCVTPASGYVDVGAAALIGIVGAVCCSGAEVLVSHVDCINRKSNGDTRVFTHHGVGGAIGILCPRGHAGPFETPGQLR